MRNDVKLGLAIGGVLLAVLIVYVLVVPGGGKKPTQLTTTQQPADTGDGNVTLEAVPTPDESAAAPPAAPGATFTPPAPANQTVASAEKPAPVASNNGKQIDWNKLLNDQPTLIAETPVPAGRTDAPIAATPIAEKTAPSAAAAPLDAPEAKGAGDAAPIATEKPADTIVAQQPTHATAQPTSIAPPPPTASARTHIVQRGETLSSISAAAYGSPNQYPAILRANPGLDPNRLKVGTTLNLPAINNAAAGAGDAQIAVARIVPAIDATRQYRVVAGDSLHKISQKLYGKSLLADKIYELNKKSIGDDPAKLKVGQVLDLPEAPTLTASR